MTRIECLVKKEEEEHFNSLVSSERVIEQLRRLEKELDKEKYNGEEKSTMEDSSESVPMTIAGQEENVWC